MFKDAIGKTERDGDDLRKSAYNLKGWEGQDAAGRDLSNAGQSYYDQALAGDTREQEALTQARDNAYGNQYGLAAMGGHSGAAMRQASYGAADIGAQSDAMSQRLRAQQIAEARQRQASAARTRADMQGDAQANRQQFVHSMRNKADEADALDAEIRRQSTSAWDLAGDVLNTGLSLASTGSVVASDEGKKERKTMDALYEAAREAKPEVWSYDDSTVAEGNTARPQVGPMAQQLERHPVTASVVYDTDNGKVIDTKGATMQQYGMLSALARRVEELEDGRKKQQG